MTTFDSPWKEILDAYFAPFLELLFPVIHREIDWARGYEFLDKELMQIVPDAVLGRGEVDKLVKAWLADGQEYWLLLHVEVQAQEEAEFARRMFGYNYRIIDRYNREVISLAILGDDRPGWRPHLYRTERWGCRTEFEFPVVKLLDWLTRRDELQASRNPVAKVILAHLGALETRKDPETRRLWKFQLVRGLYDSGMSASDARQLFRVIDWMMRLPADLETDFRDAVYRLEEEKYMPYVTSIERMAREEGLEEGKRKGLLAGMEVLLKVRFGDPGMALLPQLRQIRDVSRLEGILAELERPASLEEVQTSIHGASPAPQ